MSGVHGWGDESDSSEEEEEPVVKISAAALAVQAPAEDEAPRRGRYRESSPRKKSPFRSNQQQDTRGSRQTSLQDARRGPPPDRSRGRGGRGRGGPSNWKAAAKSESILGTSTSGSTVDGSNWMAQRRAKQQEQAQKLAQQRAAQEEQERVAKKERRASQFQALRQAVQVIEHEHELEHEQHTMPSTAEPSVGGSSLQKALAASPVRHVGERPAPQKQPSWRDRAAKEFDDHSSAGSHKSRRGSPGRSRGEGGRSGREDASSWREPLAQERPNIEKRSAPQKQPSWRESTTPAEENDDHSRVSLGSVGSRRTMGSNRGRGGRGGRGRGHSRGRGDASPRGQFQPEQQIQILERDSGGRGHGRVRSGRGRGVPAGSGHGRSVVVLDTHVVETPAGTVEYRIDLEHSSSKKKDNKAELQPNGTVVVSRGKKKMDKKQKAVVGESHSKESTKDDEHKRVNGGASPSRGPSPSRQEGGRGRGRGGRGRGRSRGGKGRGRQSDEGRAEHGDGGNKPKAHVSRIEIGKDE